MFGGLGTVAILGGLLLAAVLFYSMMKNKQRTPREKTRTEEATRDLYKRMDAEDREDDVAR